MAKSQGESPLRQVFAPLSLRGAEGEVAIPKGSPRGRKSAWPGQRTPCRVSSPSMGRD